MVGKKVTHSRYGSGVVTGLENVNLTVQFSNGSIKKFRYPDAFEGFLSVEEEELRKQIETDLQNRHTEEDYVEHRKTEELYHSMKEYEKKRAAEQEEKRRLQIERQQRMQQMGQQRRLQFERGRNRDSAKEAQ